MCYDVPVKSCPTYDNIFVEVDIAVLFKCKEDDESIKRFVYNISINQLNEQLEAAITERLRVLSNLNNLYIEIINNSFNSKRENSS